MVKKWLILSVVILVLVALGVIYIFGIGENSIDNTDNDSSPTDNQTEESENVSMPRIRVESIENNAATTE